VDASAPLSSWALRAAAVQQAAPRRSRSGMVPKSSSHLVVIAPPASSIYFLGVVGAGVAHAFVQEQMVRTMPRHLPLLITASEFGVCSGLSAALIALTREAPKARSPAQPQQLSRRALLSFLSITALLFTSVVCSNLALTSVSYPVAVIIKSCKLLPTMLLGGMMLRKRYSGWDHLSAALLCAGLVGFTLSSHTGAKGQRTSALGVLFLLVTICCDAVQVLLQEQLMRAEAQLAPLTVMTYTNGLAFIGVLGAIVVSGEAYDVGAGVPWGSLFLFGITSWLGVMCFVHLTRSRGATAAVVATNTRKLFTIGLSLFFYPQPWSPSILTSGAVIILGIALHLYSRSLRTAKERTAKELAASSVSPRSLMGADTGSSYETARKIA